MKHLQLADYLVIAVYLVSIACIGLWMSRRQKTTAEYFLANRKVPAWAVAFTMMATMISSGTFVSHPATVYRDHLMLLLGTLSLPLVLVFVAIFVVPFYRRVVGLSAYEYLEVRFHLSVRLCGTVIYTMLQLGRVAIVLYLPALAMSTVSGIDKSYCIILTGIVCTAYVMAGGIEAIVWLDAIQAILLIGGALLCIGIVLVDIGGPGSFWEVAQADGKFNLGELDWGVTTATVWVVLAGNFFARLGELTSDQAIVQRYMVTRDERASRKSLWTNVGM